MKNYGHFRAFLTEVNRYQTPIKGNGSLSFCLFKILQFSPYQTATLGEMESGCLKEVKTIQKP